MRGKSLFRLNFSFAIGICFYLLSAETVVALEFNKIEAGLVKVYYTKSTCSSPSASYGTGFFIKDDGSLITNYHVVDGYYFDKFQGRNIGTLCAEDSKGNRKEIELLAGGPFQDLALLRGDFEPEYVFDVSGNLDIQVGDELWAMGNPVGLGQSVTKGEYNGVREQGLMKLLNYTAPINAGMSGGPVLNKDFKVIGVNSLVLSETENLSFGVPFGVLDDFLKPFKDTGKAPSLEETFNSSLEVGSQAILSTVNELVASKAFKKHNLRVLGELKKFECHTDVNPEENKKFEELSISCRHWSGAEIEEYLELGRFEYKGFIVKKKSLPLFSSKSIINRIIASEAQRLAQFYKRENKPTVEEPTCESKDHKDSKGRVFKVMKCFQPYSIVPGYGDFSFNVTKADEGEDSTSLQVVYGSGVTRGAIKEIEEKFIEFFKNAE